MKVLMIGLLVATWAIASDRRVSAQKQWDKDVQTLQSNLKIYSGHFPEVDQGDLRNAIETTHIVFKKLIPGQKHARNFPEKKLIEVSLKRWEEIQTPNLRLALLFHEYLGILRLEENAYQISRRLLDLDLVFSLLQKLIDQEEFYLTNAGDKSFAYYFKLHRNGEGSITSTTGSSQIHWQISGGKLLFQLPDSRQKMLVVIDSTKVAIDDRKYLVRQVSPFDVEYKMTLIVSKKQNFFRYTFQQNGRGQMHSIYNTSMPKFAGEFSWNTDQFGRVKVTLDRGAQVLLSIVDCQIQEKCEKELLTYWQTGQEEGQLELSSLYWVSADIDHFRPNEFHITFEWAGWGGPGKQCQLRTQGTAKCDKGPYAWERDEVNIVLRSFKVLDYKLRKVSSLFELRQCVAGTIACRVSDERILIPVGESENGALIIIVHEKNRDIYVSTVAVR